MCWGIYHGLMSVFKCSSGNDMSIGGCQNMHHGSCEDVIACCSGYNLRETGPQLRAKCTFHWPWAAD